MKKVIFAAALLILCSFDSGTARAGERETYAGGEAQSLYEVVNKTIGFERADGDCGLGSCSWTLKGVLCQSHRPGRRPKMNYQCDAVNASDVSTSLKGARAEKLMDALEKLGLNDCGSGRCRIQLTDVECRMHIVDSAGNREYSCSLELL